MYAPRLFSGVRLIFIKNYYEYYRQIEMIERIEKTRLI